ncbi:MAG TPA: L,D-transpeptidase family protein [Gaiellaceae bacterium]|nr:L,D-transpeptidase family protein [Gaiellaceae bacterium]
MRRVALVALIALSFAPVARAGCGVTESALAGRAPLTVTFTAQCASASYAWDFGDGATAIGQSVQHVFAAGSFHTTLTSDAGTDMTGPVTSVSLTLTAPKRARYGQWVALSATVVPRLPVTLGGRSFVHGKLRVRVLSPRPWTAVADGVTATAAATVVPTLTLATRGATFVGSAVRVIATLHPADAGTVVAPHAVDTRTPHVAHVTATTHPAPGWAGVSQTLAVSVLAPDLEPGSRGPSVLALEQRLIAIHYAVQVDGVFGDDDTEAVYAFQKIEGLPRTGLVTRTFWQRLLVARTPAARYAGNHVEVDKTRQVLFVVRAGKVALVVATSTGATGNTPLGVWHVYRKVAGYDWVLYYPSYFLRGFAIHGYPDVPPYPASHGCARIPMWVATTVYGLIPDGSTVYVYA